MLIPKINGHIAAGESPGCEIPFDSGQGREQSILSLHFFAALLKNRAQQRCTGGAWIFMGWHMPNHIKQKKKNQVKPQDPYFQKESVFVVVSFTHLLIGAPVS